MDQTYPTYKTFEALITAALALGYALSKWTKHQNHRCPVCGTKVGVFYNIRDRRKPKIVACHACGWRERLRPMSDKDRRQARKVVEKVHRCKAITKKGTRCRRLAGPDGYCSIPSHHA